MQSIKQIQPFQQKTPTTTYQTEILRQPIYLKRNPQRTHHRQQTQFTSRDKKRIVTQMNQHRGLKGTQSYSRFPQFSNIHCSPDKKEPAYSQIQNQALKGQIRVLSANLHELRNKRFDQSEHHVQGSTQIIKNINLKLAVKSTLINSIQKNIINFLKENQGYQPQNLNQCRQKCRYKMKQILQLIKKHQNNILIKQSVYEHKQSNQAVVIYRQQSCLEDWRTWKYRYQQSQKKLIDLRQYINKLQHQNSQMNQKLYLYQSKKNKLQQQLIALTTQNSTWRISKNQIKQLQQQKQQILSKNIQIINQLKKQNSNYQQKIKYISNRYNILQRQLQNQKNSYQRIYNWKNQFQYNCQKKIIEFKRSLSQMEINVSGNMYIDNNFIISLKNIIAQSKSKIRQLQFNMSSLSDYNNCQRTGVLSGIINLITIISSQISYISNSVKKMKFQESITEQNIQIINLKEKDNLLNLVNNLQQKLKNLEFDSYKINQDNNQKIKILQKEKNQYEIKIKQYLKTIQSQQILSEKYKKRVKNLQQKLLQNSLQLYTLDMLKQKLISQQNIIHQLKNQIIETDQKRQTQSAIKSPQFESTTNFSQQHQKYSNKIQQSFLDNIQQNNIKKIQDIITLQNQISKYQQEILKLKQKYILLQNKSIVVQNPQIIQQNDIFKKLKKQAQLNFIKNSKLEVTILELKQQVIRYQQIFKDQQFTISQLKQVIDVLQGQNKRQKNMNKQNTILLQQIKYMENQLLEIKQQRSKLLQMINRKGAIQIDLKLCKNKLENYQKQNIQIQKINKQLESKTIKQNQSINQLKIQIQKYRSQIKSKEQITVQNIRQKQVNIIQVEKNIQQSKQKQQNIQLSKSQQIYGNNSINISQYANHLGTSNISQKKDHNQSQIYINLQKSSQISQTRNTNNQNQQEIINKLELQLQSKNQIIQQLKQQLQYSINNSPRNYIDQTDQYYRYKVDTRYNDLQKKLLQFYKYYTSQSLQAKQLLIKYQQQQQHSKDQNILIIKQLFDVMKKFDQTVIIKKSTLKKFNQNKLKNLVAKVQELKIDNNNLKQNIKKDLIHQFQKVRKNILGQLE